MTAIPAGTKFVGISASVPTPENKSSQNNAFQEVYTIDDIIAEAQYGMPVAPTTTTVNITSAEILTMGTTPIELLPALGGSKYYDIEKIIFEYSFITTPYALVDKIMVFGTNTTYAIIKDNLITEPTNMQAVMSTPIIDPSVSPYFADPLNVSITLTIDNGTNPTDGDGTLRAIITYTVRSFGA